MWKEQWPISDVDESMAWCEANPEALVGGYLGSKQALNTYTQMRASQLVERQVRMNAILPAPTETPMLADFHAQVGGRENLEKFFLSPIGRNATAGEMAEPMILLNSDAAGFISGQLWIVDYAYCGQVDVGLRDALL